MRMLAGAVAGSEPSLRITSFTENGKHFVRVCLLRVAVLARCYAMFSRCYRRGTPFTDIREDVLTPLLPRVVAFITNEPVGCSPNLVLLRSHPTIHDGEQFTLQPGLTTMFTAIKLPVYAQLLLHLRGSTRSPEAIQRAARPHIEASRTQGWCCADIIAQLVDNQHFPLSTRFENCDLAFGVHEEHLTFRRYR